MPPDRRELARRALDGYVSGPQAPPRATALALQKAEGARAVVLVEGISDQMAVETLARRRQRDFAAEGAVVVPIGGAQAVERFLRRFGPHGAGLSLAGLCDVAEESMFRRALTRSGIGEPESRADMAQLGFHVCVEDLEDELLRAVGPPAVERLFDSQGDLGSFRTMQKQPAWRDQPVIAQMRRFLGAGSRRKLRYARLLVETLDLDAAPEPLDGVVAAV